MEVRLLAVRSNVGNRGRALGVVIALAMVGALLSAQTAFGAGDPVASGTFAFKYSSGFKHQLKSNGVKLKPKKLKIKSAGSSLDPITGAGTLKLGKITFKKGNKKVVYSNAKATLGANGGKGNVKGSSGKLFSLKGGKVTRDGFGAKVSGVKAKLLKSAAKKINKKLGLHSLHPSSVGKLDVAEQPQTVQIVSGTAYVDVPLTDLSSTANTSVTGKLDAHCIGLTGVSAIAPAHLATIIAPDPEVGPVPSGGLARFKFPVTGGTISPAGNDGVIQQSGGVQIANNRGNGVPRTNCPAATNTILQQSDFAVNLGLNNIQAHIVIGGSNPPNFLGGPGDKGLAIGQIIDPTGVTVSADPATHTISVSGGLIRNNDAASLTLNSLFPTNTQGTTNLDFANGDTFGKPSVTVTVR
jgi:hypothetical protein